MLAALAGCARTWFAEREPWRREAEIACLKSGAVREGEAVTIIKPIEGPGVCGADYPLRVALLGEPAVPGFADEPVRPPAMIQTMPLDRPPTYSPYPGRADSAQAPPPAYSPAYPPAPGEPLSIVPPGAYGASGPYGAPAAGYPRDAYPQQRGRPVETVPLGPSPGAQLSAGPAALTPAATLACPMVSALDRFVGEAVQPAAARWFGEPVTEIKQISAYSCRGMNGNPNAQISEHAFGNALDIAVFVLADGRKVSVKDGWHGTPEEQGFLRDVHGAACTMFTTVLAPGSNAYHYDHMHVDLMRRASRRVICEPSPISGEVAAARAGGRARPAQPAYTGSLDGRARPARPLAYDEDGRRRAVPGED